MDIRPATRNDADALTALAHASKSYWDYPPTWIEAWREALTFTPGFVAENAVFMIPGDDRAAAGYALTGAPPEEPEALELQHFWLDPAHIGKGLGRRLFEHAVAEARKRAAVALWIDADPNAEAFYLHLGAVRMGATEADIDGVRRELPRLRFAIAADASEAPTL